jgi:D-serine deaminase-like pyridoxal phosphate-dependent protein
VSAADSLRVDWRMKAFGPAHQDKTILQLVESGVRVSNLPTPVLTLDATAVEHNIRVMHGFTAAHRVDLAPHGKTTMAPALWSRQLEAGAWAITVATPWQLRVAHTAGIKRIIHAGAVLSASDLIDIAHRRSIDPELHVYVWADSAQSATLMAGAYPDTAPPLELLVEGGAPGARTGARSVAECLAAARVAGAARNLQLCGVTAWEGSLRGARDPGGRALVAAFCDEIADCYEAIANDGLLSETADPVISAGGSSFFDVVVDRWSPRLTEAPVAPRIVLRSGCYLTHDDGLYQHSTPFNDPGGPRLSPALNLWAQVVSKPESSLALLNAGRRDAPYDGTLPIPQQILGRDEASSSLALAAAEVTQLNDQHAYLKTADVSDIRLGDTVRCGISHPCTAFDKWAIVPIVDDGKSDDPRLVGALRTVF